MTQKKEAQVIIDDKVITVSADESVEYMQKVALYINNKKNECRLSEQYHRLPPDYQSLLLSLNIADDFFKAKDKVDQLQAEIAKLEKQNYDIQHEQIEMKIKYESSQKMLTDYKEQLAESQKKVLELESSKASKPRTKTTKTTTTAKPAETDSRQLSLDTLN
jgi:cell division protein ZapA